MRQRHYLPAKKQQGGGELYSISPRKVPYKDGKGWAGWKGSFDVRNDDLRTWRKRCAQLSSGQWDKIIPSHFSTSRLLVVAAVHSRSRQCQHHFSGLCSKGHLEKGVIHEKFPWVTHGKELCHLHLGLLMG